MPVAHLPQGAQLYYTDSGEPSEPEYDTIVIVHGVAYNAGITQVSLSRLTIQRSSPHSMRPHLTIFA